MVQRFPLAVRAGSSVQERVSQAKTPASHSRCRQGKGPSASPEDGKQPGKRVVALESMLAAHLQRLYRDQGIVVVEEGRRLSYFCVVCRKWAFTDSGLADHLQGKVHCRAMVTAVIAAADGGILPTIAPIAGVPPRLKGSGLESFQPPAAAGAKVVTEMMSTCVGHREDSGNGSSFPSSSGATASDLVANEGSQLSGGRHAGVVAGAGAAVVSAGSADHPSSTPSGSSGSSLQKVEGSNVIKSIGPPPWKLDTHQMDGTTGLRRGLLRGARSPSKRKLRLCSIGPESRKRRAVHQRVGPVEKRRMLAGEVKPVPPETPALEPPAGSRDTSSARTFDSRKVPTVSTVRMQAKAAAADGEEAIAGCNDNNILNTPECSTLNAANDNFLVASLKLSGLTVRTAQTNGLRVVLGEPSNGCRLEGGSGVGSLHSWLKRWTSPVASAKLGRSMPDVVILVMDFSLDLGRRNASEQDAGGIAKDCTDFSGGSVQHAVAADEEDDVSGRLKNSPSLPEGPCLPSKAVGQLLGPNQLPLMEDGSVPALQAQEDSTKHPSKGKSNGKYSGEKGAQPGTARGVGRRQGAGARRKGMASVSKERTCFICGQHMKEGDVVGTLWCTRTCQLACSSRNDYGKFHIFHLGCIADWAVFSTACIFYSRIMESPTYDMDCRGCPPALLPSPGLGTIATPAAMQTLVEGDSEGASTDEERTWTQAGISDAHMYRRGTPREPMEFVGTGLDCVNPQAGKGGFIPASLRGRGTSRMSMFGKSSSVRFSDWGDVTGLLSGELFCPECQGSGIRDPEGTLEHPRYRLCQIYDWILEMLLARTPAARSVPGADDSNRPVAAVAAVESGDGGAANPKELEAQGQVITGVLPRLRFADTQLQEAVATASSHLTFVRL